MHHPVWWQARFSKYAQPSEIPYEKLSWKIYFYIQNVLLKNFPINTPLKINIKMPTTTNENCKTTSQFSTKQNKTLLSRTLLGIAVTLICFKATAQPLESPHLFQKFVDDRLVVLYEYPCELSVDKTKFPLQGSVVFGGPKGAPPILFCFGISTKTKQIVFSKNLEKIPTLSINDFTDGGPIREVNILSLKRLIKQGEAK